MILLMHVEYKIAEILLIADVLPNIWTLLLKLLLNFKDIKDIFIFRFFCKDFDTRTVTGRATNWMKRNIFVIALYREKLLLICKFYTCLCILFVMSVGNFMNAAQLYLSKYERHFFYNLVSCNWNRSHLNSIKLS